jgi:hypothetical protein
VESNRLCGEGEPLYRHHVTKLSPICTAKEYAAKVGARKVGVRKLDSTNAHTVEVSIVWARDPGLQDHCLETMSETRLWDRLGKE